VVYLSAQDEDFVIGLIRIAAAAHRPASGSALPPPAGAALASRRRFR
jgi:hypothetical protein